MKTEIGAEAPPEDEQELSTSCQCFTRFHNFFRRKFYDLGYLIGRKPSYFIIVPVFLTLLGLTGIQNIRIERDTDYLFVPTDGVAKYTRDKIEELFPENSTGQFDPSRITRATDFAKLLITTKDNDTMLRNEVWDEVIYLDVLIQNLTIELEGEKLNYSQICSKFQGYCFPNLVFNLNEIMYEIANGSLLVSYPVMLFPLVLPLFYGGPEIDEENGILLSTKGVYTVYFLAHDTTKQKHCSELWERELLNLLEVTEFEHIHVDRYVSRSLVEELAKNGEHLLDYLPIAVIMLFVFSLVSVSSFDWVRSKSQMSILGLFTIIMSVAGSFGGLMYLGVRFVSINSAVPFLILGIGLDTMYIILASWNETRMQDSVPHRMAATYGDTAISVTITSLTTLVSFFVGTFSSFPAVKIFCIYLGTTVFVTYVWFLTFFGACLAIVGYMEKNQQHVFSCRTVKAKSETANDPHYRIWCAGGINRKDPWNAIDNKPGTVSKFFRDVFGKALTKPWVKAFVIFVYGAYLGGAIYGSFQIKQGVDRRNIAIDGSYLTEYYKTEDELFRKFPYRIQVIVRGNLSFHEESTKEAILDLHNTFEKLSYVGPKLYTRSWMRGIYNYLRRRPLVVANITNEGDFINVLENDFLSPNMRERLDIYYNENKTRIEAVRFVIQGYEVHNMEEDFEMVKALREVADNSPFDEVLVYHPSFVYYDQYLVVGTSALMIICVAAFILILITLIFIPNVIFALWIGASIISINFGVVGYMALWNVRLDTVALVNLILCIGFSVDYAAHVSYSFLSSPRGEDKIRFCLYRMGLPVLQSGASTIVAITVFIFTSSYIYRTFFKIILLVTLFGMAHSLVLLPVLLSIFCANKPNLEGSSTRSQCTAIAPPGRNSFKKLTSKDIPPCRHKASVTCSVSSCASDKSIVSESISSHLGSSNAAFEEDSDDVESVRL